MGSCSTKVQKIKQSSPERKDNWTTPTVEKQRQTSFQRSGKAETKSRSTNHNEKKLIGSEQRPQLKTANKVSYKNDPKQQVPSKRHKPTVTFHTESWTGPGMVEEQRQHQQPAEILPSRKENYEYLTEAFSNSNVNCNRTKEQEICSKQTRPLPKPRSAVQHIDCTQASLPTMTNSSQTTKCQEDLEEDAISDIDRALEEILNSVTEIHPRTNAQQKTVSSSKSARPLYRPNPPLPAPRFSKSSGVRTTPTFNPDDGKYGFAINCKSDYANRSTQNACVSAYPKANARFVSPSFNSDAQKFCYDEYDLQLMEEIEKEFG